MSNPFYNREADQVDPFTGKEPDPMDDYVTDSKSCEGRYVNGPGKRFVRCDACGHIEYEKNEGDRHG